MQELWTGIKRFLVEEEGATATEYAVERRWLGNVSIRSGFAGCLAGSEYLDMLVDHGVPAKALGHSGGRLPRPIL
jgi:hypothetical protein